MSRSVDGGAGGVRAYQTVETSSDSFVLEVANPLPALLPMAAADLATVFAAVAISLMERGREEGRAGRKEGRGTLRLFITAGAVELLRLNPKWPTDRPTDRPADQLGPLAD